MDNHVDDVSEISAVDAGGQPATGDDLDSLLQQFDNEKAGVGRQPAETPQEPSSESTVPEHPAASRLNEDEIHRLALQAGQDRALIEDLLRTQHFNEMRRQETADYGSLLKEANQYLKGAAVTEDYADRYLRSEYELNPEVKQAWDQRYDSAEAKSHCDRVLKKTLTTMAKAVSRIPDRQATEDRELVAAAVRGTGRVAAPDAAPNYSRMSSKELEKEWEKFT